MSKVIYGFLFIFFYINLFAQADHPDRVKGDLLVWLEDEVKVEQWIRQYQGEGHKPLRLEVEKKIRPFNLFHLRFDESVYDPEKSLTLLMEDSKVAAVQFNYKAKARGVLTPNDPEYSRQWDMDIIDGPEAWDITTGGTTANGDEIVVAVLDEGLYQFHPDLAPNLWHNAEEIPDNGIDDDNNGRIDDVTGWNVYSQSDNHMDGQIRQDIRHGTAVSGIIGAKGDNSEGVTGVNWNTKIMMLTGVVENTTACEAYGYVYEMRDRYNKSGGTAGAFVVATNYSLGFDNSNCLANHACFNLMYNTLGNIGVLNTGATANRDVDVENVGDTPSDCPSDFLIAVTNTDRRDELVQGAGYGPVSIDLSAPGRGSYTTVYQFGNDFSDTIRYDEFTGTSAATPHVAGAIALLYSIECPGLAEEAVSNPSGAATKVKEAILEGVDQLPDLQGKTVTGGRLNVAKSLEILDGKFGIPRGDLEVLYVHPNPMQQAGNITVFLQTPEIRSYEVRLYDSVGRIVYYKDTEEVCAPKGLTFNVTGLANGVYYLSVSDARTINTKRLLIAR